MKWLLIPITWLFSKDGQLADLPSWLVLLLLLTIAFSIFFWYCLKTDLDDAKRSIEGERNEVEKEKKRKQDEFEKKQLRIKKNKISNAMLFQQLPSSDFEMEKIVKKVFSSCDFKKLKSEIQLIDPNFHYQYLENYSLKRREEYREEIVNLVIKGNSKFPFSKSEVKLKLDLILDDCVQIGVEELITELKLKIKNQPSLEKRNISKVIKWDEFSD